MALKGNVERQLKHLFDGTAYNVYDDKILNLGVGAPGEDLLSNCCNICQQATEHRMQIQRNVGQAMLFQYGAVVGPYETRSAIAKYFNEFYEDKMKCEDLCITAGATQGLNFLLTALLDMNGYVFVDEFTYMIALDVIKQLHTVHIFPVRLQQNGVDTAHLEQLFKQYHFKSAHKPFWAIYYTIPVYHNPTGIVFSSDICKAIIKLSRQYDVCVVCDDVYNILNYVRDGKTPKRLFAYDNAEDDDFQGNVVSNGSFSKLISPGLRIGWIEAPVRIMETLIKSGSVQSGGCFNNYTAGVLASLFELGLAQQHISQLYEAYKERMIASLQVLEKLLPSSVKMFKPTGGYFIWLQLPAHVNATDFLQKCMQEERIFFIIGNRFAIDENMGKNCLRIAIAFQNKEKLIDGCQRLCLALKKYLNE